MATELVYFQVSGTWFAPGMPPLLGTSNVATLYPINGQVTFYPRVPPGFVAYIPDLDLGGTPDAVATIGGAVALPPINAQIVNGVLDALDIGPTPGIGLLANSTDVAQQISTIDPNWLLADNPAGRLIYDVVFTNTTYTVQDLGSDTAAPIASFGFVASTDTTPIDLTDPSCTHIKYAGPISGTAGTQY